MSSDLEYVNFGASAKVFRQGQTAIKFHRIDLSNRSHSPNLGMKMLSEEHEMNRFLYQNGVSVPKPHGIFYYNNPTNISSKKIPGFAMQFIDGKSPDAYRGNPLYENMMEQKARELEKILQLGIKTKDTGNLNNIWSPREEKLYLIDFASWKRKE